MKIKQLKLKNYRNYDLLELYFDSSTNILYGDNAQGKTNILESIYMCGTTKSHRGTKDRDMIRFGQEEAHIEAVIDKKGVPFEIDIHLKNNSPKGVAINKMPIRRAIELFGIVNIVFFSPEDLNIIKNGPSERRKFIDLELSQLDKVYLSDLSNYNRIVNQRNKLLKDVYDKKDLIETLDIWDLQLVNYGKKIIDRRNRFIVELNEIVGKVHEQLTGGKEHLQIYYEPSASSVDFEINLKKNREKDIKMKSTSVGPHRDDICFMADGLDIRKFGSQGQQRTAALSLKLSEIEIVKKVINDTPILLLDDVLSELDRKRQKQLLDSIEGMQTILTCTGLEEFVDRQKDENKLFYVENGAVTVKN